MCKLLKAKERTSILDRRMGSIRITTDEEEEEEDEVEVEVEVEVEEAGDEYAVQCNQLMRMTSTQFSVFS
eukprot:6900700-Pyramimonas_sp.AAC.1